LQFIDASGLEHRDIVVVDRGDLVEHLPGGHRREQVRVADPVHPLLSQLAALLLEVSDQLGHQLAPVAEVPVRRRNRHLFWHALCTSLITPASTDAAGPKASPVMTRRTGDGRREPLDEFRRSPSDEQLPGS
jgi:hypothetical protein